MITDAVNGSLQGFSALKARFVPDPAGRQGRSERQGDRPAVAIDLHDDMISSSTTAPLPFCRSAATSPRLSSPTLPSSDGADLVIHVVIAGGSLMAPTVLGLDHVLLGFPIVRVVVWLNGYFGDLDLMARIRTDAVYREIARRIRGLVRLPELASFSFRPNVQDMLMRHLTFQEALNSPRFLLLEKQRLIMVRRAIWAQTRRARALMGAIKPDAQRLADLVRPSRNHFQR